MQFSASALFYVSYLLNKISDDILTGYDTDKSTEVIGYGVKF